MPFPFHGVTFYDSNQDTTGNRKSAVSQRSGSRQTWPFAVSYQDGSRQTQHTRCNTCMLLAGWPDSRQLEHSWRTTLFPVSWLTRLTAYKKRTTSITTRCHEPMCPAHSKEDGSRWQPPPSPAHGKEDDSRWQPPPSRPSAWTVKVVVSLTPSSRQRLRHTVHIVHVSWARSKAHNKRVATVWQAGV
jgi:hypothetical protein